eukprot:CAMPEP_0119417562 /NCGR_PEP_ID=MMETSP1335-20130426/16100_1 /TAXON_ID=259385 /ORGANISM="Chrysoculter rhomboideus, Strain RCC1486" /LENGTH=136 /DNA_ID=CAMNT_0007442743 /DNA_START=407 /DNA_END=814 /DNA_ORIENTATION=-
MLWVSGRGNQLSGLVLITHLYNRPPRAFSTRSIIWRQASQRSSSAYDGPHSSSVWRVLQSSMGSMTDPRAVTVVSSSVKMCMKERSSPATQTAVSDAPMRHSPKHVLLLALTGRVMASTSKMETIALAMGAPAEGT